MSNDKWILCKDKLPELAGQPCFVSTLLQCDNGERFEDVYILRFQKLSKNKWKFVDFEMCEEYDPEECVAWMPIEWPDPYKEEGGETCTT